MGDFLDNTQRHPPLRAEIQTALNLIPAFAWCCNPSGGLSFLNERGADYLGLPKDHPIRHGIDTGAEWDSHIALLHPDDHEEARRVWSNLLRTGCAGDVSFRVRSAEGGYRWHLSRAEPVRASDGTLLYWLGVNLDIADGKHNEFYLAEGQRLARTGSWAFNAAGFYYWSPELFRIYGLDPSGKPPTVEEYIELVHPDDREFVAETIQKMFAEHRGFDFTKRIVRPDGEIRRVRCVGSPATHTGAVQEFIGTGMDVTEHELLTQELRRREAYLAEAQRLSHTGSFGWKPDTGEIIWSDETYRIFEYDRAVTPTIDLVAQRAHPEDRADVQSVIERASRGASDFEHAYRLLLPYGRVKHVHALVHATKDAFGNREFVGAVTDITEQRRAEESLRASEAYLVEAQRLSHTGSWSWSPTTDVRYWSEECYRILGFDPQDGLPGAEEIIQRIHPDDQPAVREIAKTAKHNKLDEEMDYRILHPGGAVRYIHSIGHPVFSPSGDLIEYTGTAIDITDRKRAEEDLRASERKYRHLVDTTPAFIHTALPDGSLDFLSRGWLEYGGLPQTDSLDWRWTAAIHPEDLEGFVDKWRAALASGEPFVGESRVRRADGEYRWFLQRNVPLRDETGTIVKWYGTGIDIEERKRAEESLRSSEAYLAEAQRLSQTGSWAWSPDQDIRYGSEECYRVLSFDPQDGLPRFEDFFQRIHPDDQPGFRELIETAIREKAEWEADYRIVHPDGPSRDIHVVGHPVLSTSGHLVEFVGTVIDVTERKRAEEELRRSEAELRQMLDLMPQHLAVLAPDGTPLYANRVALEYLGVDMDRWRTETSRYGLLHPEDRETLLSQRQSQFFKGTPHEFEARMLRHDGIFRWFLFRLSPLKDERGDVTRWYGAGTDIEDRKQAEDRLRQENVALREEIGQASMFEDIVGTSPALKNVLSRISKVAPTDSTVLITGETGTGKELVARAIHRRSDRASRPFVGVNCAAIPRDLIASELFGHEKGAFTGASQQRLGRFELANGGTLFLDEVGELPVETQIALLRVLQEHEFERVGGARRIRTDVRVIAATNRDLQAAISAGSFRSDLFYRLNVFPIEMPSLRDRKEDIPLLVEYFIDRYARKAGKNIKRVNKKALELLQAYPWPGNIRELQNVIERSVILCETEIFSIDENWLPQPPPMTPEPKQQVELTRRLLVQEKDMIEEALKASRGRVFGSTGAAVKLGIPRSTLESKIKSLKIDKNRFRTLSEI